MSFALCVAGCGGFARTFARAVRSFSGFGSSDDIEMFFASRDRSRARAYCRAFEGAGYFGSYEEAAADPRVEAMYFCTPHHLHLEHALIAARSAKHIMVEKPIARTVEEGERIVSAAREAGVKLMVAENFRYMPAVRRSRELITQGAIGKVRLVQIQEESNFSFEGWRTNRELMGGGVLIDGGIHSIDMLIDLGGTPEEVYASSLPRAAGGLEGEDGTVLMARLRGGATGLINHAWGVSRSSWKLWVAVSGTRGRIFFKPRSPTMTLETDGEKRKLRFSEDVSGIGSMVREFRDCIREDRPALTSGEEGLRDLRVVLCAYESAENRGPVAVEP